MKKVTCGWCKKELKDLKGYEAYITTKGTTYQMLFCSENHARDMAWSRTEVRKIKINPEAWGLK